LTEDATDPRGDAQDFPMDEDSALDKNCDGYAAAESEGKLVFETIPQSLVKNQIRSKSQKIIITYSLMSTDSENELPRQQPHKHIYASKAPPSASGHTKSFR
jgi:hypothetical protein